MARREPRRHLTLEVRITFEPSRVSPACIVQAYEQVVPIARRTTQRTLPPRQEASAQPPQHGGGTSHDEAHPGSAVRPRGVGAASRGTHGGESGGRSARARGGRWPDRIGGDAVSGCRVEWSHPDPPGAGAPAGCHRCRHCRSAVWPRAGSPGPAIRVPGDPGGGVPAGRSGGRIVAP